MPPTLPRSTQPCHTRWRAPWPAQDAVDQVLAHPGRTAPLTQQLAGACAELYTEVLRRDERVQTLEGVLTQRNAELRAAAARDLEHAANLRALLTDWTRLKVLAGELDPANKPAARRRPPPDTAPEPPPHDAAPRPSPPVDAGAGTGAAPDPRRIVTLTEWREQHGVHRSMAMYWASTGRLGGAYRSPDTPHGTWMVPMDTPRPSSQKRGPAKGKRRSP